eukprot:7763705-Heterocapsa_arctica.AAC.1
MMTEAFMPYIFRKPMTRRMGHADSEKEWRKNIKSGRTSTDDDNPKLHILNRKLQQSKEQISNFRSYTVTLNNKQSLVKRHNREDSRQNTSHLSG